jgi:hypothetical protein
MKKHVLTLFVLLTALVAESYAQTKSIEYSNLLDGSLVKNYKPIMLSNGHGYYIISSSGYDYNYKIVGFNKDKQKVSENSINGSSFALGSFIKFFITSDKLICFTAPRNYGTKSDDLLAITIDANGKMGKPKLIVSSPKNDHLEYQIQQNESKDRFLINRVLLPKKRKSPYDVLNVIVDENLNKVHEDRIQIPYLFISFRVQNIVFDGKNKVFLHGGSVYGNKLTDKFYHVGFLRNHIIFSYDLNSKTLKETDVKIDVQVASSPHFMYSNGAVYLVGNHYKNYMMTDRLGTYFLKFDAESMTQLKGTIEWFDPSKAKIPTGKDIGKVGSNIISTLAEFNKNGEIYLFSEYSIKSPIYNINEYDMSMIQFDENGYIKWIRGLSKPKPKLRGQGEIRFDYPKVIQTPEKIYILFADSYKNNALRNTLGENARKELDNNYESTTLATVNELGEVTYDYVNKKGDECTRDYEIMATIFEDKLVMLLNCAKGKYRMMYYPIK